MSLGWHTGVPEMTSAGRVSCTGFSPLFEGSDRLSLAASQSQANVKKGNFADFTSISKMVVSRPEHNP